MYDYKSYTGSRLSFIFAGHRVTLRESRQTLIEDGGRTREYSNWKTADVVWPRGISETSRLANLNRLADIHPNSFRSSLAAVTTKAVRNISHAENGMRVSILKVAPLESIRVTCGCMSVINSRRYSLWVTCNRFDRHISKDREFYYIIDPFYNMQNIVQLCMRLCMHNTFELFQEIIVRVCY